MVKKLCLDNKPYTDNDDNDILSYVVSSLFPTGFVVMFILFSVGLIAVGYYNDEIVVDDIDIIVVKGLEITDDDDLLIHADNKVYISTNRKVNQMFIDYNNVNVTFEVKYKSEEKMIGGSSYPHIISIKEV